MTETQDEAADLDSGWDDVDVDSAPAPSGAPVTSTAPEPSAEEVDGGWDDAPSAESPAGSARRLPHRKRRPKSAALPISGNGPVLMPRPAEPTKRQQREHARQQKAHEARVKEQRKAERKAERLAQAKREADQRSKQAEAEAAARRARQEARERARSERPAPSKPARSEPVRAKARPVELERPALKPAQARGGGPPFGVIITWVVLAGLGALFVHKK
jgi:hypothetical protein